MNRPSSHRARKRFGQNFLIDTAVIDRIVAVVNPAKDEHLVEIGPGKGALTEALLSSGCHLDVIELDRDLVPGLLAAFSVNARFTLHQGDALTFDYARALPDAAESHGRLRIVGNLPYNISTPLIFRLLEQSDAIVDMHFMLQKEVVERLAASPGGGTWGRLGIMAQFLCKVEQLFDVPPSAFRPIPRVNSAIVRLTPWGESPWPKCEQAQLHRVVKNAFAQRRKTLRNNLKGLIDTGALEELGIDPGARAETLNLTQFIDIAKAIHV
ncbi:MAG: 16S rRNA (adenine(1518)-N(6)/adenine(1519)-N(6))-dimethyltransferase RsmA [Pseudomonadota bacterium]